MMIKCSRCKGKLLKYIKIGSGQVIRCWKDRIIEDHCVYDKKNVVCTCGQIIGIDNGPYIKMKKNTFYTQK
jgi:hypothetical protein